MRADKMEKVALYLNDTLGNILPRPLKQYVAKTLYKHGKLGSRILTIDLTASCNLRCPSCPVGSIGPKGEEGVMSVELLTRIIKKARDVHNIRVVALHNWTEPFLHPQLAECIRIVKDHGLICALSTNLTIARNINAVIAAKPDFLRISLSGFHQDSYEKTHVRGNIEHVKANMKILSNALKQSQNKRTCVSVFYHKYKHNLQEMPQMKTYAKRLGFAWEEIWAYYMSVEKMLDVVNDKLNEKDKSFMQHFALPIPKAIEVAKQANDTPRCSLLENQIIIDYQGKVNLCCAVYDTQKNQLGNFLAMDEDALTNAKSNHPTCATCTAHNLHQYFTYYEKPALAKQYDQLARENCTH